MGEPEPSGDVQERAESTAANTPSGANPVVQIKAFRGPRATLIQRTLTHSLRSDGFDVVNASAPSAARTAAPGLTVQGAVRRNALFVLTVVDGADGQVLSRDTLRGGTWKKLDARLRKLAARRILEGFAAAAGKRAEARVKVEAGTEKTAAQPAATPDETTAPVASGLSSQGEAVSRDDALLGGADAASSVDLTDGTAAHTNPLTVGGLLYLRSVWRAAHGNSVRNGVLSAPSLAEVFLDGQPNDRVRGMVRARLRYDPTYGRVQPGAYPGATSTNPSVLLDQFWIKFDIARSVFLTIGKQHNRWGVGRFWQPTDFLQPVRRSPTATFDERTGVNAIKLHIPWESAGWNFYGVALLEGGGRFVNRLDRVLAGGRMEILLGAMEVGIDALFSKDAKPRVGVDASVGFGPFDFYVDAGFRASSEQVRWVRVQPEDTSFTNPAQFRAAEPANIAGVGTEAVFGTSAEISYGAGDAVVLGGEYFYRSFGYDDKRVYPWLALGPYLYPSQFSGAPFTPFYVGRYYAALFASLPSPGSWDDVTFTLTNISNLSDHTYVSRIDFALTVLNDLRFEVFGEAYYGERGGEFQLDLSVPPSCADGSTSCSPDQQLPGFSLRAPRFAVGLALRLAI